MISIRTLLFLIALQTQMKLFAQADFFHDIIVSKTYYTKDEKYAYTIMPGWKRIYNAIGWRRWSATGQVKRQLSPWNIGAGIGVFYTFDKNIKNNIELRPFLLIGLKTPISNGILFSQTLKSELRTLLYKDAEHNSTTGRLRYNINAIAIFHENSVKKTKWKLRPEVEWYLEKNKEINERFVSSTEYTLTLLREIKNIEVGIGYRLEQFNRNFITTDLNGHTISIEINF